MSKDKLKLIENDLWDAIMKIKDGKWESFFLRVVALDRLIYIESIEYCKETPKEFEQETL